MAITALRGQLQSYSDACEALSAIEVTLGFLSTAGGDPDMHLNVYIQDMLKMGDLTSLVSKVGLVSGLFQRKLALSPPSSLHFLLGYHPLGSRVGIYYLGSP